MASTTPGALERESAQSVPPARATTTRLYFVDNLRTTVIILVVLVHVAIVYGGLGSESIDPAQTGPLAGLLLAWFAFVNQAFLMGLLFFIAGYFISQSLMRKGAMRFTSQRLLRLGIPLLVYDLLINPPVVYLQQTIQADLQPSLESFLVNYPAYLTGIGTGPTWFISNLLLFSLGYVVWCTVRQPGREDPRPDRYIPGGKALLAFALFLTFLAFLVRLVFPIGWASFINVRPQYYWQYIPLFVLGIVAWQRQWLTQWPDATGKVCLVIGVVASLLFPLVPLLGNSQTIRGGLFWQSFVFSAWEAIVLLGLGLGLLLVFRRHYNQQGRLAQVMASNAYTVYIIHVPVIFFLLIGFRSVMLPALLKFALVSLMAIPLCFVTSHYLVRRLPLAKRIL